MRAASSLPGKQAGASFMGWLILLTPLVICAYAALRLVPVYLTQYKVSHVLSHLASEHGGDANLSTAALRAAVVRNLDINSVEFPTADDFTFVRQDGTWVVTVSYEDTVPLFLHLSLLASYDKQVRFP
jgi:hypothetical protein